MRRLIRATPVALLSLLPLAALAADRIDDAWSKTLHRVSSAVVSIRVDATRAFDTEWNLSGQATGFVVDAKRGIILTNRHVVQPGPVVAEAVFENHEEVALTPIYRDPVHDFGFYHYDPKDLHFSNPVSLPLAPEDAHVGEDIRVVGNDAGEQLSILSGTLARLDREAPDYGRGSYNDFNTFYYQAASGTSGGSSGSPVVNIDGEAIALNAGARVGAASSFFLPLERVRRALRLIQARQPIPRGTIETVFSFQAYDELRRLGLRPATEAATRKAFPRQTGMLVVDQVIPGGPADGSLQPGDILVRVDGHALTRFDPLEDALDGNVGDKVGLDIERGGKPMHVDLAVRDLHAISPASFLQFGGAVLNRLSYQQARSLNVAPKGVFVADPGYAFSTAGIERGDVVVAFDGKPVDTLDDLQAALETLDDGARVRLRFFEPDDPQHPILGSITVDRRWFPARRCERDDGTGTWPCTALPKAGEVAPPKPVTVTFPHYADPRAQALAPSLVFVNFDMPYQPDGVESTHYAGTGIVIDARHGLVAVDRNTVPVGLGDVHLTFAGSVEIPGKVVYVHPLHDLAVISYDPKLLGDTPVRAARFATRTAQPGDDVWVIGFKPDQTLASQATQIASEDPVMFPLSRTFRFRDTNLETYSVVNAPDDVDGVLADRRGRVVAMWASFAYQGGSRIHQTTSGIPAYLLRDLARLALPGAAPLRTLDAEFTVLPLASARKLGLPAAWAKRFEVSDPDLRQLLSVVRITAGSPAEKMLQDGDILLAMAARPIHTFAEMERASQTPVAKLTILRDGKVHELEVPTDALDGRGTERILLWGGALLQKPHRAVAAQRGIPRTGVLVGYFSYGSPASRYGLAPGLRIVAVDGQPTPSLDSFLDVVSKKHDREAVRLKTVDWQGQVQVITLKLDLRYWPTYMIRHTPQGWVRDMLQDPYVRRTAVAVKPAA